MKLTGPRETMKHAKRLRTEMSLPEVILWQALRRQQTGLRFRKQHPAGPYVLDFYCDATKLCVEVDGEAHSWRFEHDRVRDQLLAEQGVTTIRVLARDVLSDLDAVVAFIVAQAPSDVLRTPPPPEGEDLGPIQSFPLGGSASSEN